MRSVLLAFALGALFVGCAPEIGDSCKSSVDCSVQGDRICDETLPNGYCTVLNCDPDSCPNGARCVEWRGGFDRTAIRVRMKRCNGEGGCRDGYECIGEADVPLENGVPIARVVDLDLKTDTPRFCSFPPSGSSTEGLSTESSTPFDGDARVEPDAGL